MEKHIQVLSDIPWMQFTHSEVVRGHYSNRTVEPWYNAYPAFWWGGDNREGHISVGAWREKDDRRDPRTPVFVPFYHIDLDDENPLTNLTDARHILLRLTGLDMTVGTFVSYSGNRGFHISISSGLFGNPVYASKEAAKEMQHEILSYLCGDVEYDSGIVSPLHLFRLPGSFHEKSQRFKIPMSIEQFWTDAPYEAVLGKSVSPDHGFIEPTRMKPTFGSIAVFKSAMARAEATLEKRERERERRRNYDGAVGEVKDFIEKLSRKKIREGQVITRNIVGRNKAAFVIACGYLDAGHSPEETWAVLNKWNEEFCTPPMEYLDLDTVFKSATKMIQIQ